MTSLAMYDPVNLLPSYSKQMDQLFKNPWSIDNAILSAQAGPAVTVYETAEEYILQAELPGWTSDQISIDYKNQTLSISGMREFPQEEGRKYHRVEGLFGQFLRSFTLPAGVDTTRAGAEMKDGILTIHLPLREDAKPRQIEVRMMQ